MTVLAVIALLALAAVVRVLGPGLLFRLTLATLAFPLARLGATRLANALLTRAERP